MLWLALHLPMLPLEAFCATLPVAARPRPVALLDTHRIAAVNRAAAAGGVRPGLKRATALALMPELLLAESESVREAAALRAVAHTALAFTPSVTLQDAQTVLLEVQASLRLFGGLPALHQRLTASLAPLGHRVQFAAAPTALGAALLAQWQRGERDERHERNEREPPGHRTDRRDRLHHSDRSAPNHRPDLVQGLHTTRLSALTALLDDAPVWLLGPGREHWEALQGMGLQTLSDLRHLPRAGLARRFGDGLLDDLDRALGRQADPRRWIELPAAFDSTLELFARADSTEQVLHGASVLLARLVAWAQARQARVAAFTLRMRHEPHRQLDTPATELQVELAEPALDATHLQLLLRERLARIELAAPTLELQLHCSRLAAGPAPNGELFPTRASEAEGLVRLLERLRARLGDAQVQRLVAVADHRPERATRGVPAQGVAVQGAVAESAHAGGALPLHRPVWLLPEPMPLAERDQLPLLEGRVLQAVSGPERVEAGWWDGPPAVRDYFIVQTVDGALLWVYRRRLPPAEDAGDAQPGADWFLQGRFG